MSSEYPQPRLPPNDPIYGYLSGSDEYVVGLAYGSAMLRLRPDLRARTTFTFGNSLDDTNPGATTPVFSPCPVERPTSAAAHTDRDILDVTLLAAATRYGYAEAQIFGGVTVDNIEEVVLDTPSNQGLVELLDQHQLQWRIEGGTP